MKIIFAKIILLSILFFSCSKDKFTPKNDDIDVPELFHYLGKTNGEVNERYQEYKNSEGKLDENYILFKNQGDYTLNFQYGLNYDSDRREIRDTVFQISGATINGRIDFD